MVDDGKCASAHHHHTFLSHAHLCFGYLTLSNSDQFFSCTHCITIFLCLDVLMFIFDSFWILPTIMCAFAFITKHQCSIVHCTACACALQRTTKLQFAKCKQEKDRQRAISRAPGHFQAQKHKQTNIQKFCISNFIFKYFMYVFLFCCCSVMKREKKNNYNWLLHQLQWVRLHLAYFDDFDDIIEQQDNFFFWLTNGFRFVFVQWIDHWREKTNNRNTNNRERDKNG